MVTSFTRSRDWCLFKIPETNFCQLHCFVNEKYLESFEGPRNLENQEVIL